MSMSDVDRSSKRVVETGALCAEAQADGVPCPEIGRACEVCERALEQWRREGGFAHPALLKEEETLDA